MSFTKKDYNAAIYKAIAELAQLREQMAQGETTYQVQSLNNYGTGYTNLCSPTESKAAAESDIARWREDQPSREFRLLAITTTTEVIA